MKKLKIKAYDLKRRYGISLEEYDRMVEEQDGRCGICGVKSKKSLHVDHNHKTGKVRKLLCHHCNTMIGLAKEDPFTLQRAMNYLFLHNH